MPRVLPEEAQNYPRVTELIDNIVAPNPNLMKWVREKERSGFDTLAFMREAADKGTEKHEVITQALTAKPYTCPKGFEGKLKRVLEMCEGATEMVCEEPIWDSRFVPFRGTPDLHFIKNDKLYILDWKSGRPSRYHALQLHAYRQGLEARIGRLADVLVAVYVGKSGLHPHPEVDSSSKFPLYLGKNDIQPVEIPIQEGLWDATLLQYAYFNT